MKKQKAQPQPDPRATAPWTPEELDAYKAHCQRMAMNYETTSPEMQTDFIRKHRGLPPLPRPEQPPLRWERGAYSGMKSIADYEAESYTPENAFGGIERPGAYRRSR